MQSIRAWIHTVARRASYFVAPIRSGYDVLRILLAVILLTAAGLKAHQLATEPILGTSILDSRWLLIGVVEFELFFGLWLLSGLLPRPTWVVALSCFSLFACVSLDKAITGHATCGCFGRVPINPWYTGLLDLAVLVSLFCCRPAKASFFPVRRVTAALALCVVIGGPAAFVMGTYTDTSISDAGEIIGNGTAVVLKPETWIGKKFPLLGHIDIGDRLTSGLWLVLLYRHDCSACRKAAMQYELLAKDFSTRATFPTIALIECPPYTRNANAANDSIIGGRMDDGHVWQLSGPTGVLIDAGQVRNVFTNGREVELFRAIWGSNGG